MLLMNVGKKPTQKAAIILLSTLGLLIVAGAAYGAFAYAAHTWPFKAPVSAPPQYASTNRTDPNAKDPTISGAKQAQTSSTQQQAAATSTSQADLKDVEVGISHASAVGSNLEVRAFVSGVIEGTGTCTATLTSGDLKVSQDAKAFIDASTSQCEVIDIPLTRFSGSSSWQLVISYLSPTSKGTSAPMDIKL